MTMESAPPVPPELTSFAASIAGRYQIERPLGSGGMALVFLAHDRKHHRKVALKVLRPELSAVLGGERFLQEIRTTANLQHPHILPLHDSGESDGLVFYVMPFIEGETLRDRLDREKQLPIDDAVRIACEVASALDYAHRQGIVHRDIKPGNILLHDGSALVADFGIALAASRSDGDNRLTRTGVSLGTPQYMAPEQAMGERTIDGRADVYALGAVIYEMLTGEPPFSGPTAQAIVAKALTEPPVSPRTVRDTLPQPVEATVLKALAKLPADRFESAAEFERALSSDERVVAALPHAASVVDVRSRLARAVPWAIAAAAVALLGVETIAAHRDAERPIVTHFDIMLPTGGRIDRPALAIAPAGDRVLFAAHAGNSSHLYVRELANDAARLVPGGDGSWNATFSPDGANIATRNGTGLATLPTSGGAAAVLAKGGISQAPTWGSKGTIVYAADGALWAVGADGSSNRKIVGPDSARGYAFFTAPDFLPGGDAVLATLTHPAPRQSTIAVVQLSGAVKDLGITGTGAHYQQPGYLLVENAAGQVSAMPFDIGRLRATGRAVPVLDSAALVTSLGGSLVSVSADGRVAGYLHGGVDSRLALLADGGETNPLSVERGAYSFPRISPDGAHIAVARSGPTGTDIWIIDLGKGTATRLTTDGMSTGPVWSADGRRITFAHRGSTGYDIWQVATDGSSAPAPLLTGPGSQRPAAWTPDGRTLVYVETPPERPARTMALTNGVARSLAESPEYASNGAAVSPDGRWLAAVRNTTTGSEVFVQSMAAGDSGQWQVSQHGGSSPQWSRDGGTLYYTDGENVIAASLEPSGNALSVTGRRVFAPDRFSSETASNYTVMPDGRHLLIVAPSADLRYTIIVNWLDELRRKVAAGQ